MKAQANIIGFVLIGAIAMFGAYVASQSISSHIKYVQQTTMIDSAVSVMSEVGKALNYLAYQSTGSSYVIHAGKERVFFSKNTSSAFIRTPSIYPILPPGSSAFVSGVRIYSGADASGHENSTNIVLENSVAKVVIKKQNPINTSQLIEKMVLKPDTVVFPDMGIRVGDNPLSEYGNGLVYLATPGTGLPEAVAVATISDSSSPYNYSIIFSLPSGADYLKVYVRGIKKN